MSRLTPEAAEIVTDIASRYGVSTDAVTTLLIAVANGNGMQAQFNHHELGGMGQWSNGGMTMVGDMFNNGLKATVDGLCSELSGLIAQRNVFVPLPRSTSTQSQSQQGGTSLFVAGGSHSAWPDELGFPSSTGAQNTMRYGVFPEKRRLAVDIGGRVDVYDTGEHQISGVSQQQSGDQSLTFTSQYGVVRVADLPKVQIADVSEESEENDIPSSLAENEVKPVSTAMSPAPAVQEELAQTANQIGASPDADGIITLIRKLADLREGGILTDAEFEAKKAELLSRL